MKKLTKKRIDTIYHKISVLSSLMLEAIEELENQRPTNKEFKESLENVEEMSVKILDASFVEEIKKNTYFTDLSNKVDTIIRKNYQKI